MLSNIEQITGYRYLCQWTQDRSQDGLLDTVARSDWFHYCITVCIIESTPVDCNHYFYLLNKFKLNFCLFLLQLKSNQ